MCCGQTKTWENTTSMLDYWRAGPFFWVLLPIHCDGLAFASSNALDGSQACAPMVIASDRNDKPKCMTGWLLVDKIDLGQVEKMETCKAMFDQLMGFLFAAISAKVRSGEVQHFNIFNEDPEETWFSVRSGEIVLAIDKIWPPNIPSTYHFLGATATYFCQFNLFDNGKEVLQFKNAAVHKPSSCCISTYINFTHFEATVYASSVDTALHALYICKNWCDKWLQNIYDKKSNKAFLLLPGFWNKRLLMLHCLEGKTLPEIMP